MNTTKKGWVIYNPYAGRFPAGVFLERAADMLSRRGWTIHVAESKTRFDMKPLAQRAVDDGADAVFVAGGDGSVGQVASVLAGTQVALGVLPAGTANVWARELGLSSLGWIQPLALEEAAKRLASGEVRRVDLGECSGGTFMLWAGIGLDGKIVNSIEPRARWEKAFAIAHYATLAVWESLEWTGIDLSVSALGQTWEDRFVVAVASNIRAYAGGYLELSPEAKIDDGLLDFWLLRGDSIRDAVGFLVHILLGSHVDAPEVVHFRAGEAKFEAASQIPLQFDGDPQQAGNELHLRVRRKALNVLVPPGGWPQVFSDPEAEGGSFSA
jgi:YegS/Rv2252/BmrU family lipid kinase